MSFQGKKNIYLCHSCGWGFVTQDVDEGTTPFTTACRRDGCDSLAQSFCYRVPQELLADVPAVLEWHKPSREELMGMPFHVQNHVDTGGLVSRPARRQ